MSFKLTDTIKTTYIDTARYDIKCSFKEPFNELDNITIHRSQGLTPFTYVEGTLKTPEYTIEAYVTPKQDVLLKELYSSTMHPEYVDIQYPVTLTWGLDSDMYKDDENLKYYINTKQCYLCNYTPPTSIDYSIATILSVSLVLRVL